MEEEGKGGKDQRSGREWREGGKETNRKEKRRNKERRKGKKKTVQWGQNEERSSRIKEGVKKKTRRERR